jgi:hypothetical protein
MLIQFTRTSGKHLYIRSEDLRRLEDDTESRATIAWIEGGETLTTAVQGSAQENYTRLAELERSATQEYERRQLMQRMGQLPPAAPVARGKPR